MKFFLLVITLIVFISSCTKDSGQISNGNEIPSTEIEVAILDSERAHLIQQSDALYNFLGFGYDVTDSYSDAHSVRAAVIDMPKFVSQNPSRFDLGKSTQRYWNTTSAVNAEDFAYQLSKRLIETNGFKLFKNSLPHRFFNDDTFDKKYIYGNYALISEVERIKINFRFESIFLTPTFKQDVNILNAAELVKKYGTHVLQDIKLGSKLSVYYQAQTASVDRINVSKTGLRYVMKKFFGLSTGELDPVNFSLLNANSSAKIFYEATGGDVSLLEKTTINGNQFINPTNWSNSLTLANAKFIDVAENGLIPLYDFIEDSQKQGIVKDYITKYISENQVVISK